MASVSIKKGDGDMPSTALAREWEPFQAFRDLLGWDPFAEMMPARGSEAAGFAPAFDVKETKDAFVFTADLPGIKESDLDVRVSQNRLTVSGKRESEKSEKSDTYYTYERSYGTFSRTFTLPDGLDASAIKADLKNGVLTLELPKPPELQPKKIPVKTT